ncbi:MAG: aminoglycoside phosphotransferase family protein [Rickettsiales endosymbiont of Dermacentor nuttalli]
MLDHILRKQQFLNHNQLKDAITKKTIQDASTRVYERLISKGQSYILMDTNLDRKMLESFIMVDKLLLDFNFSAPRIIVYDYELGFALLEDFGDDSYKSFLEIETEKERLLYKYAIDLIVDLQNQKIPSNLLPSYSIDLLLKEVELFVSWYIPLLNGEELSPNIREEYIKIWIRLLTYIQPLDSTLVLRDYHADNLMWLPERSGIKKVGLLDFQDAVVGSPIYDVVSLLEDARRDIKDLLVEDMISYYLEKNTKITRKEFLGHYAILGVQRNLKIIGIFACKAVNDKNSSYLKLIPRVWRYINNSIKHPLLRPMHKWLEKILPIQVFKSTSVSKILY